MSNEWNIGTGSIKNYNSRAGRPVTIAAVAHAGRPRYHAATVESVHTRKNIATMTQMGILPLMFWQNGNLTLRPVIEST